MLVLAIDTATPAVTAGVVRLAAGDTGEPDAAVGRVLGERITLDARAHGELITPHVREAVGAAGVTLRDLDAVVCGIGPGPYTGLRAGIVTAAALAHALDVPAHPVCSLDAVAAEAVHTGTVRTTVGDQTEDATGTGDTGTGGMAVTADAAGAARTGESFVVLTDARRREVYWAAYDATGTRTDGPHVDSPAEVPAPASGRIEHPRPGPAGLVLAAA
ncbi:tRNA (adenosine(37)-N6)-threonylcarbamoyltransferase complex dimerization subunit type 1 TsaB, partial [Saccharomonospora iraqiensis]|uniref:tRNA (adenosine(37)-N6)-threonylcarbamoyltransferase complex dimerization subunit type 1 TsaB n=1 Tax=Saccharomonospora iraqiensis TaxID=52698 RepID=UPI00022E157C